MITVGTCGHIDHGKTSIIESLTGVNPDRLPVEIEKGITTDLGFAHFEKEGITVGFIDVPGHKQYVHNVAAGLFACDAVMLVIAADDGWMPQTEEHLNIVNFLGIDKAIVVINKIDLVSSEQVEVLKDAVKIRLNDTCIKDYTVVLTSTKTGAGIDELEKSLVQLAKTIGNRTGIGRPRIAVDRVFSVNGFGEVATGTLRHGYLTKDSEIIVTPSGKLGKIKSIESFGEQISIAKPGDRIGISVTGLRKGEIKRGDIVTADYPEPPVSKYINVGIKVINGIKIKNLETLNFQFETKEVTGRLVVLEKDKIVSNSEYIIAQIRLSESVSSFIGEKFIMRRDNDTVGGGIVLCPQTEKVSENQAIRIVEILHSRLDLTTKTVIKTEIELHNVLDLFNLPYGEYSMEELYFEINHLIVNEGYLKMGDYVVDKKYFEECALKVKNSLIALSNGINKDISLATLKSTSGIDDPVFSEIVKYMIELEMIEKKNDVIWIKGAGAELPEDKKAIADSIIELVKQHKDNPLTIKDIQQQFPNTMDVLRYLTKNETLIEIPDYYILTADTFKEISLFVVKTLNEKEQIAIQDIAKKFGYSRKYNVPILMMFDRLGVTQRRGDIRLKGRKFPAA